LSVLLIGSVGDEDVRAHRQLGVSNEAAWERRVVLLDDVSAAVSVSSSWS
jgi:hypothetical protein